MGEERVCRVCADRSDGAHFGVDSCRACAAFFRRSIVMNKKYLCRQGGKNCPVNKSVRCMCRFCRLEKCKKAGMSREGVQNPRDLIGRRDSTNSSGFDSMGDAAYYNSVIDATPPYDSDLASPSTHTLPILSRLQQGYAKLNEKRSQYNIGSSPTPEYKPLDVYTGNGFGNVLTPPSTFSDDVYRPNYQSLHPGGRAVTSAHTDQLVTVDYPNIIDFVNEFFPRLEELDHEQRRLLFRGFLHLFVFMEGGCRSATANPGRIDKLVLSDGNYIDMENLAFFFSSIPDVSPEEANKTFRSSFDLLVQGLLKPLLVLKPNELEVAALIALTFYNVGLDGIADETNRLCQEVQDQIFRELMHLYAQSGMKEPALRIARLTMLMPALQRMTSRHWEDLLISKLFIKNYNDVFYRMVKPT